MESPHEKSIGGGRETENEAETSENHVDLEGGLIEETVLISQLEEISQLPHDKALGEFEHLSRYFFERLQELDRS